MHVDHDDIVPEHLGESVEEEGVDVGATLAHLLAVVRRESTGVARPCSCPQPSLQKLDTRQSAKNLMNTACQKEILSTSGASHHLCHTQDLDSNY